MFKIMIVGGPADPYIDQCLNSLLTQSCQDWEAQVVLDPVGDGTYARAKRWESVKIKLKLNETRLYATANLLEAARLLNPQDDDILVTLDADDWLAHKDVLSIVKGYYDRQPDLLLTHGSWTSVPDPNCYKNNRPYSEDDFKRGIRKVDWRGSHLRTFKYKVWKCINDEDLRGPDGGYLQVTWDCAFMWIMMEISGLHRIKFIPEILYVYNQITPSNDSKLRLKEQMFLTDWLAAKPPYSYRETF